MGSIPSVRFLTGEVRVLATKIKDLGYPDGIDINHIQDLPPEYRGIRSTKLDPSRSSHLTLRDMITRESHYNHQAHITKTIRFRSRLNRALNRVLDEENKSAGRGGR